MNAREAISIAILPFENFSDKEDTAIFCKSFCIDLITELSTFKQFKIIAYQTTKLIAGASEIDHKKLDDWHIDYFVQGSFRDKNKTIRVNAQLFDRKTNRLVWANRFEGALDELINIQDQLLQEVVSALQIQVNEDLLSQKKLKPKVKLKAYECWLYGLDAIKKGTLEADLEARRYFRKAIDIEPDYSLAYSGMSLTYFNEWSCRLWDRWGVSQNGAFEWARKAIELDEDNYIAAHILGRVFLYEASYESAEYYLRRSLQLNSNDPESLIQIASCFTYLGLGEEATKLYKKAILLNPAGVENYHSIGVFIYFERGEFAQAKKIAQKSVTSGFLDANAFYAATFHYLGDNYQMRLHWSKFIACVQDKIMQGKNTSDLEAIQWMKKVNPYRYSSKMEPFWEYITDHKYESVRQLPAFGSRDNENTCVFRKEGELWQYNYGGSNGFIPEVKGFHDIQALITAPGKEMHCCELMGSVLIQQGESLADNRAKDDYLKKLHEIRHGLAESEAANDYGKSESLQKQYDELVSFLSKVFDNKGRFRKQNDTVDKTRSAVTWRIRSAISKLEKENPHLGKHFNNNIKTGTYCCYSPESEIAWNT